MSLQVNAYVVIDAGCPVAISIRKPDHVEIVCGWTPHRAFEFSLHRDVLQAIVELGTDALINMAEADDETAKTG